MSEGATLRPLKMVFVWYNSLLVVLCLLPVWTIGFTTTTSPHNVLTPFRRHHYHNDHQSPMTRLAALSTEDKQYYVVQQTVSNSCG